MTRRLKRPDPTIPPYWHDYHAEHRRSLGNKLKARYLSLAKLHGSGGEDRASARDNGYRNYRVDIDD